VKYSHANTDIN